MYLRKRFGEGLVKGSHKEEGDSGAWENLVIRIRMIMVNDD